MTTKEKRKEKRKETMNKRTHSKGQGIVEFAMVVTLFILLLAGLIDFGWAEGGVHVLASATREGARVASFTPDANRQTIASSRVKALVAPYFATTDVAVTSTNGTSSTGDPIVTVTATGKLPLLAGLIPMGQIVNGQRVLTIVRTVSFRDETRS